MAREAVASWPTVGTDDVFDELRASYCQGREWFEDARAAATPTASEPDAGAEPRHEWRKRVNDHGIHLRLPRAAWPAVLDARTAECDRLAADLGTDHDLAALAGTLATRVDVEDEGLPEVVARRRGTLAARTDPLGRRPYADPPRAFADRLRTWWLADPDD